MFVKQRHDLENGEGLIEWLATEGGSKEYVNPVLRGRIKVAGAGVEGGEVGSVFGKYRWSNVSFEGGGQGWVQIDLGRRTVFAASEVVVEEEGGGERGEAAWSILGSEDGNDWVDAQEVIGGFRYIRIRREGEGVVEVGGMELFGNLFRVD